MIPLYAAYCSYIRRSSMRKNPYSEMSTDELASRVLWTIGIGASFFIMKATIGLGWAIVFWGSLMVLNLVTQLWKLFRK